MFVVQNTKSRYQNIQASSILKLATNGYDDLEIKSCTKGTYGEAGSAPTREIEPFRERVNDLMKSEWLHTVMRLDCIGGQNSY